MHVAKHFPFARLSLLYQIEYFEETLFTNKLLPVQRISLHYTI